MNDTVRAFLAVELRDDVKAAVDGIITRLVKARVAGLRPVKPNGLHLTMKFFGDIDKSHVTAIAERVTQTATSHRPFEVQLGSVGAFPTIRSPRVLWVGIGGDIEPLRKLHARTEQALGELGVPREERAFNPHITLARISDKTPQPERRRVTQALFSADFEVGMRIEVSSLCVMRSILRPEGAYYERLAQCALGE